MTARSKGRSASSTATTSHSSRAVQRLLQQPAKACEYFKRGIDVFWRMVGADLKPDLLVALRNHRIIQTGGENAILVEMSDYRFRALGITEHQWYNRVLPGECLEAKPNQASLETHCHGVKVIEQRPPDGASSRSIAL